MGLLRLPEPYDFELSTGRFRAFGPDLANLWVDGSLHRVVGRREVRIAPANGGVRVEPLDDPGRFVIVVRDAHRHPWQRELVPPGTVVVETGLPEWRPPAARGWIATYGAGRANLEAAAEVLRRR